MKKFLAITLSLVLTVCLLSACNDKADNNSTDIDGYDGEYQGFETDTVIESASKNTSTDVASKRPSNNSSTESSGGSSSQSSGVSGSSKITSSSEDKDLNNESFKTTHEYEQDGRHVKVVEGATLEDYTACVNELLNEGYSKYDENEINKCQFVSLTNQNTFVSVSYTAGDSKLKVISEPLGDLYPRKQDNIYTERNMQSLFTGMKNQNKPIYSGMGFIIRLSDGRFIIIDGGGGDYNHLDSNNILNILKSQSPKGTEKPVIAAWIFTHAHDDHIGAFNAFTADFANKVKIESFYYNFPPVKVIGSATAGLSHEEYYSYSNFVKCIKKYPDAKIIRPHAGEKYYIGNAVIDMLFSYEDLFPLSFESGTLGDFNHTSLVFKITIGGQSMLITGDATTDAMYFIQDNFGSFAQSDILQMSHHGQFGTRSFYSLVNPTYALLPISHVDINRMNKIDANRWLASSLKLRQVLVFWGGNVTIPLPYNPTDDQISDRIPTKYTVYYDFPIN